MAHVITDPCIGVCDAECVNACPVDAIHGPLPLLDIRDMLPAEREGRRLQLYIDPETCICCGACEPVCPVGAIFDEDAVPAQWRAAIARNAAHFGR